MDNFYMCVFQLLLKQTNLQKIAHFHKLAKSTTKQIEVKMITFLSSQPIAVFLIRLVEAPNLKPKQIKSHQKSN